MPDLWRVWGFTHMGCPSVLVTSQCRHTLPHPGRETLDKHMCVPATCNASELLLLIQSLSCVRLLVIPWTATFQTSLSFTISWSLLKLMSIESMMLFNHLILCRPLLLLPSTFPSIRVFSNELALGIKWPKYYVTSYRHKLKIMAPVFSEFFWGKVQRKFTKTPL